LAALGGSCLVVALTAAPALAGTFSTPSAGSTFNVSGPCNTTPANPNGKNCQPFDISGTGWTPANTTVFVEQCDGTPSTTPGWDPTVNCDNATSPAGVASNAAGQVSFPANNPNFAFVPVQDSSPQGFFNCLAPGEPDPGNGLPNWTNCQVRMSTTNFATTPGQDSFITLAFGSAVTPEAPYAILLPLGALGLLGGGYVISRKRRHGHAAAAA
jgi:hypothetical protein